MDTFESLESLLILDDAQSVDVSLAPAPTALAPTPSADADAEFMRMISDGESPSGYFSGYCVVA